jgi:GWxTD domain-containing protein
MIAGLSLAAKKPAADSSDQRETVAKPLSEKEQKKREAKLRKELETPYRKWLNEDVVYIITDEEKQAFKRLQTDEERQQFIEQFWLRRDPTPDTAENEYKEEHYRRIAYANEHFASKQAGWQTDRGQSYIVEGPPEAITYSREGDVNVETWHYDASRVNTQPHLVHFVDRCNCGEFVRER